MKVVAGRTVASLMAEMPEIGTLSNKAAAKLAGLAPIANDSGKDLGRRPLRGGREGGRPILFVVAEVVRRYEPDFHAFHQKLSAAGDAGRLSAATPGGSRTSAWRCAMPASASPSSPCSRPPVSSWLQDASPGNCDNRLLEVE